MKVGSSATLDLTFRDSSTDAPVTVDGFHLVFFDLDSNNGIQQRVSPTGFAAYDLHASTALTTSGAASSPTFKGGAKNTASTNPTNMNTATKRSAVNLHYESTSSFQVTLRAR